MDHTNLLIGSTEWAYTIIPKVNQEKSSDVTFLDFERMNIADVRALTYEANMRPSMREYRVFIISCLSILTDAQNALLKLFEEPNAHTIFYFIIPRGDMLLPTLMSRFSILGIQHRESRQYQSQDFFRISYTERLALIAQKIDAEDSVWIQELVKNLAEYAHTSKNQHIMEDILFLEKYIHTAGCSPKMLLEHVALSIPQQQR